MALRIIKEHGGSVPFDIINSLIVVRELSSWLYKQPWRCRGLMVSVHLLESFFFFFFFFFNNSYKLQIQSLTKHTVQYGYSH